MSAIFVYMTTASPEEARVIGRAIVEERLAACVNIIEGMRSIYRWEGNVREDTETVLIAKSHESRLAELTERIKSMHSYDCPCIVALPIHGGNGEFLDWIRDETV